MEILAATKVPNEIAAGKRCCKRSGSACPGAFQDAVLFPGIHQAYITMSDVFDVHKDHMKPACKPATYWK